MNARVLLLVALLGLALVPTGISQDLLEACDSDGDGEPDGILITPPGGGEPICSVDATAPVEGCFDVDDATPCVFGDPSGELCAPGSPFLGTPACPESPQILDPCYDGDPGTPCFIPYEDLAGCVDGDDATPCPADGVDPMETICTIDPDFGDVVCGDPTSILASPPEITLSLDTQTVLESDAAGTFTFTRSDVPTSLAPQDVTVRFTLTLSAGATEGADFARTGGTPPPGAEASWTIVLPAPASPGDGSTATVLIDPLADTVLDDGETITIALVADPEESYTIPDPAPSHTLGITDVPPSTVSITVTDDSATEGSATDLGTFTLARTEPTTTALKVKLEAPSGAPDSSFELTPESADGASPFVTIPAGATSTDVRIRALDDAVVSAYAVTLTIAAVTEASADFPAPYLVGTASATVTFIDNDLPSVSVSFGAATGNETQPGTLRFTRSDVGKAESLDVAFEVSGTAVRDTDYRIDWQPTDPGFTGTPLGTTFTFAPDVVTQEFRYAPLDDTALEGTETIEVSLTPAATYQIAGGSARFNLTDDDLPLVTLTAKTPATKEGSGTGAAFTVTRNGKGLANELTVAFQTSGAAAADYTVVTSSGVTFQQGNGNITFPANVRSVNVTVNAIDDSVAEGNETLLVQLKQPTTAITYGVGSPSGTTLTIEDNDILDNDNDGVDDRTDNCVGLANASQADADADKQGNACDTDDDNDGVSDAQEATLGSDPLRSDSDGDGRSDGAEVAAGTDPTDAFSPDYRATAVTAELVSGGVQVAWRSPAGSITDRFLVFRASTPTLIKEINATSSQSAYLFIDEQFPGGNHTYYVQAMLPGQDSNAFDADVAVASGAIDAGLCEVYPADSDDDGLCDREEALRGTDAQSADSDNDGLTDKAEVDAGSDPTDPLSPRIVTAGQPVLSKEGPFWLGLAMAVGALALLVVGVVMMRKSPKA